MTSILIVVVVSILSAFACGHIAERKGRSRQAWFLGGIILGPLPLIVLPFLPPVHPNSAEVQ